MEWWVMLVGLFGLFWILHGFRERLTTSPGTLTQLVAHGNDQDRYLLTNADQAMPVSMNDYFLDYSAYQPFGYSRSDESGLSYYQRRGW